MKLSDDRTLASLLAYRVEEALCGRWDKDWTNNPYVAFRQLLDMYNNEIAQLEAENEQLREDKQRLLSALKLANDRLMIHIQRNTALGGEG